MRFVDQAQHAGDASPRAAAFRPPRLNRCCTSASRPIRLRTRGAARRGGSRASRNSKFCKSGALQRARPRRHRAPMGIAAVASARSSMLPSLRAFHSARWRTARRQRRLSSTARLDCRDGHTRRGTRRTPSPRAWHDPSAEVLCTPHPHAPTDAPSLGGRCNRGRAAGAACGVQRFEGGRAGARTCPSAVAPSALTMAAASQAPLKLLALAIEAMASAMAARGDAHRARRSLC